MLKKEAREIYKEKRMKLSEGERSKSDDLLLLQFQTVGLPFLHSLMSYWPIGIKMEPNTHLFTEFLRFRNPEIKIAYPVSDFNTTTLTAFVVGTDTTFLKKKFNLTEPQKGEIIAPANLDLIFVPLLAIDKKGFRAGYGKGFYDKFLARCRTDCIKVGFSYFEPVDAIDDCNDFDVPLDLCITPHNTYVF